MVSSTDGRKSMSVSRSPTARLSTFVGSLLLVAMSPALADMSVLINPGDQGEQSRFNTFSAWKAIVDQAMKKEKVGGYAVAMSTDATADLGTTRSRIHDVFVAPAHVVGSALRYGYQPVAALDRAVQAVLVAPRDSAVASLADVNGKRLGMPPQDSLVTYLLRGEVNAANTTIKRHFGNVYETRYQDALLVCLQVRRCDVVAVERQVYDRWVTAGEQLKVIMESKAVPGLGVAIKSGSGAPTAENLRLALAAGATAGGPPVLGGNLVPVAGQAYDYVATLGYFTPRQLPGATVVDAKMVQQLIGGGALYIDTRTEVEFKAGHVPGARLVPYVEKSAKDADFKASDDQFDLSKLPPDRQANLVFACNGAECWKSFKASLAAVKAGYTKVHWFRGGFPEWRSAGLKVESAAN
jgi:rhodanese-related sulfurtransferase